MNHSAPLAATFSIAARDAGTGMLGVAVASKVLAVGASCPFVRAGVGAISSQAYLNPALGVHGLELLSQGLDAEETLATILADDDGREWRQLNIVDSLGRSAAFGGQRTDPWSEVRTGPEYALGGNLLVGPQTVAAMEKSFLHDVSAPFGERLMRVLEAADAAGGDMRGKQSAALYVVYRQPVPYINLRVDDHPEPIRELRRLLDMARDTGLLEFTYRVADTLTPRPAEENVERQRALRRQFDIPNPE